jgi:hypothetical protein
MPARAACLVFFAALAPVAKAIQTPRIEAELDNAPILVPLRRESVPIRRQGRIVTYKTSYSGVISLGYPAQEFRVVFDTGSGHVVVPSLGCQSEACQKHRRYDLLQSETGVAVNSDGKVLGPKDLAEEVTIGFGTGEIKGQFAKEHVCLSPAVNESVSRRGCLDMDVIMAVEMSTNPFSSFVFDGILGLGLPMLAMTDDFSFFDMLTRTSQVNLPQFAVFLTEGEDGEASEIAFGGLNQERALEPVKWSPVVGADEGHWLIKIKAVRVNGETLDVCEDGTCKGVVDTGTSHIGVPISAEAELSKRLTVDAEDYLDCRLTQAPTLEFVLEGAVLSLYPQNYMRRLPLREGVNVGATVVSANDSATNPVIHQQQLDENATNITRHCSPRTMPVNMPAPLGPKLFILGEPLLHRYYTVYDWKALQVGFSLANSNRNTRALPSGKGSLPEDVQLLMQRAKRNHLNLPLKAQTFGEDEPAVFIQVVLRTNWA